MAIDALFGDRHKVSESIISGVSSAATGVSSIDERITLLIKIRNALVHGDVAAIEQLNEYVKYYEKFDEDPVYDQMRILRICVFSLIERSPAYV